MIKIEAHNEVIEIETDGTMDDLIGEAMCSIRSMYDFFREHNEEAARAFKALLQKHTKDDGALFSDKYIGETVEAFDEDLPF